MSSDLEYYLLESGFDKYYSKIIKKYKNKTILIYGAGQLFELINSKYDLSKLNIIGISDGKYTSEDEGQEFLGYKKFPVNKIRELNPDYVLVATLRYLNIAETLEETCFKNSRTKIRPLAPKPLIKSLKEIWS